MTSDLQPGDCDILVVGEEPADLAGLSALLAAQGYTVQTAASVRSGLDAARLCPPDLILLDMAGLGEEVYAALTQIRTTQATGHVPVLLIGGPGQPVDSAAVFASGAADYVARPLIEQEVLARVEAQRALKALREAPAAVDAAHRRESVRRRATEGQLQESGGLYRSLVEGIGDVLYAADAEGVLVYASPAVRGLLGYEPEEVIGRHVRDFVHPDDWQRQAESLSLLLAGGSTSSEYRLVTRSGDVRWVRTSSQPVISEGGIAGVRGLLADITDRKLAEQRLEAQNEFLNNVLESLTHPFYVIDAGNYSVQMANTAARLAGVADGSPCFALTHRRDRPCEGKEHPCPLAEVRRTGKPVVVEHLHHLPDGSDRYVEVYAYPLFGSDGRVEKVIEYTLDITERRQVHAALRESEMKLRMLFQVLPVGVSVLDRDRHIISDNPALEKILGLSADELRGGKHRSRTYLRSDGTVMPSHEFPSMRAFTEQQSARDQVGLVKEDGSVVWIDVSAVPVDLANWQVVLTTVDITALKQAEEALRRSEALLRQTQLAAGIGGWELDVATQQMRWTDEVYRIHEVPLTFPPSLDAHLASFVPEDREMVAGAVQQAMETGVGWDLELGFVTAGGKQRRVRTIGQSESREGRVVRLWGTFQDETERKRAEQALQEAAVASERSRLARELHDSVSQALFSASLVAEILPQVWQRDPGRVIEALEDLRRLTRGALAEMRAMLIELRPSGLLESRLDDLIRQLAEATASRGELAVSLRLDPVPALPPEVQVAFYRVGQEALHNAVKHSRARRLEVRLSVPPAVPGRELADWPGELLLEVEDDGLGFDPQGTRPGQMGLRIMRERAESIGARLTVDSQPGAGTRVALAWQRR